MTKKEYIYLILNRVKEGGKVDTTKIHPKDVEFAIAKYRSHFIKSVPEDELAYYTKPYTISVSTDATTHRKYITLPVQIENLQRLGKGVVNINTLAGYDFKFIPVSEDDFEIDEQLEANLIYPYISFITRFDRVDFDVAMTTAEITSVIAHLIPTFDEFEDSDKVPVGNFEREVMELATGYLSMTPEPDLKNN
jgi:hypothetical protein